MAKQFVFRFETMLKIRRQREDHHKRVVGQRLRQVGEARQHLESLQHQIQAEVDAMRRVQQPGTIDMQQAVRHRHWLGHLHKGALEMQARIQFLETRLAQERATLAEAAKQRKILEKLRERQADRHRQAVDRREMLELDEMATIRFVYDKAEN